MAPNVPQSIFDPLSCTGTQWIVDKVLIEHSLQFVLSCDIHTARFLLDCNPSSCVSMYAIQSLLSSTFRGLCGANGQTDRHPDEHGDSMTESAQWGRFNEK
jgi:hypothetical protein